MQFGGELKEKGCRYELKVTQPSDMNRSVIKSDYASVFIPELELEIPAKTQRGSISTIGKHVRRNECDRNITICRKRSRW